MILGAVEAAEVLIWSLRYLCEEQLGIVRRLATGAKSLGDDYNWWRERW